MAPRLRCSGCGRPCAPEPPCPRNDPWFCGHGLRRGWGYPEGCGFAPLPCVIRLPRRGEGGAVRETLRRPSGGVPAEVCPGRPGRRGRSAFDLGHVTLGFGVQRREGRSLWGSAFSGRNVRRCPTLPRGLPRSTIGAEGLNFRVRDGTGCFPLAMAAATLRNYQPGSRPYSGNRIVDASPRFPGDYMQCL